MWAATACVFYRRMYMPQVWRQHYPGSRAVVWQLAYISMQLATSGPTRFMVGIVGCING
jgi:hypothetical protein